MNQGFGGFGGFGQTNRPLQGIGSSFNTQSTSVPSWNIGATATATQPIPIWNQPFLTQPTTTTQPIISVPYEQAGGNNPPNQPSVNPPTGRLDPNVVALINTIEGLN